MNFNIVYTNSSKLPDGEHSWRRLSVLLLLMVFALSPLACNSFRSGAPDAAHSSHSSHASPVNLELNNGKKWVVPTPMMTHVRNLENAVQDSEASSAPDHAALATNIQENLGRLATSCTLEGKAHDELHKWLMPFLGLSADYTKATEPAVQQEKLQEIKQSLLVFNSHFE